MKKFTAFILMILMTVSLAACGSETDERDSSRNRNRDSKNSESESDRSSVIDESDSVDDSSSADIGYNSTSYVVAKDGLGEGIVGDTMRTQWFDFTVNWVTAYGDKYEEYTAAYGNRLLALNLTIENTFDEINPMSDADFMLVWGDGDDDYAFPVENAEDLSRDILPTEYDMNPGDKVTGDLLFEVPENLTDFGLIYIEIDDADNMYDSFAVYFQVNAYDGEYIYGELGDTMNTYWFDFTVTSATLHHEYAGQTPSDGCLYLALAVTMENTYFEAVPMYIKDFDVEWEDPESYEIPVILIVDGEELAGEEYELPYAGSTDVIMIFEVPEEVDKYFVCFDEYFVDGSVGDTFAVYFEMK